jgi:hypothetical protein
MRRFIKKSKFLFATTLRFLVTLPQGLKGVERRLAEARSQMETLDSLIHTTERDALFASVGRALTAWSKMEEFLVIIVGYLLRVRTAQAGLIMYSILNFGTWLSIIHDLMEMHETFAPQIKRWNKISERVRKIKDRRDQLAHHSVRMQPDVITSSIVRSSQFDTRQKTRLLRPLDKEEVIQFIDAVLGIADDLEKFIDGMHAMLPASQQKSSEPGTDHCPEPGSQ